MTQKFYLVVYNNYKHKKRASIGSTYSFNYSPQNRVITNSIYLIIRK